MFECNVNVKWKRMLTMQQFPVDSPDLSVAVLIFISDRKGLIQLVFHCCAENLRL